MISIERYTQGHARAWKEFLSRSNNGTLFHDLDFLSYHPEGRFQEDHLLFTRSGKLAALLPAADIKGKNGKRTLESPYGASVGGPVLPMRSTLESALEIIGSLQAYARRRRLSGIRMRLGPLVYQRDPSQTLEFALSLKGFALTGRWLTMIVPLSPDAGARAGSMISGKRGKYVRAALKKGLFPREVDGSRIPDFHELLSDTMLRHAATATHTKEELERLFRLVPGKVRLFLCEHRGREIAGVLVFMLNEQAAYTMYICGTNELQVNMVLLDHIMTILTAEGVRYLDLGPSASTQHVNAGGVRYKEMLGAQGFCRDAWYWERS